MEDTNTLISYAIIDGPLAQGDTNSIKQWIWCAVGLCIIGLFLLTIFQYRRFHVRAQRIVGTTNSSLALQPTSSGNFADTESKFWLQNEPNEEEEKDDDYIFGGRRR